MKSRAAITDGNGSFIIDEVTLSAPSGSDVLVRIHAAGICHTDSDSMSWGQRMIMGHEGAGVVEQTGPDVSQFSAGDRVLLNWAIPCGTCYQCERGEEALCETHSFVTARDPQRGEASPDSTRYENAPIHHSFNLGTMSEYTIVKEEALVRIGDDIPFPAAAILGCGVMTGVGSVINAAKVEPGASVVVLGCGGVGLNVIQGARIAGAASILAVDLSTDRLQMATDFGASHTIQASRSDKGLLNVASDIREICDGRGADYAFECTAKPELGAAPLAMIRNGGTAIQVSGIEQEVTINMELFEWDKTYINPLYGKCCPQRDFPLLLDYYRNGELKLDEMVTRTYPLDDLALALDDMHNGRIAKGVLVFNGENI